MKHYIIPLLFLSISSQLFSRNYYFSSSAGNDSYSQTQAQNPSTPWKTVDKLNSSMSIINPGDSILFKKGDVFYGQINLTRSGTSSSPIVFGSYGTGSMPEISGCLPVSSWSRYNGNIWVSTISAAPGSVNAFFINDQLQQIGRYPNSDAGSAGYLNIDSHSGQTVLTSSGLGSSVNFAGADAIIRTERWIMEKIAIQSHSGHSVTLVSSAKNTIKNNYGFFIQNHLGTLDQNGEWYFDKNTKKVYLYSVTDPNDQNTAITNYEYCFYSSGASNFCIDGVKFMGAQNTNIWIGYGNNINVRNNSVVNAGNINLSIQGGNSVNISNNVIAVSNNNGLMIMDCENAVISGNDISDAGVKAGMGSFGVINYRGVFMEGTNIVFENNQVANTGYNGIQFGGNSITIRHNFITDFCLVIDDGAGIYTSSQDNETNQSRVIEENIILNGRGQGFGTDRPGFASAEGIYLDNRSNHIIIRGNTIANCSDYGIFGHNANNLNITGNTLYNNRAQLGLVHDEAMPDYPVRNCNVQENVFFSKSASQYNAIYSTVKNDFAQFGSFDNNIYCRPVDDDLKIRIEFPLNSEHTFEVLTLKAWQERFSYDMHSGESPVNVPLYSILSLNGGNKITNGTFSSGISGWGSWSSYNNQIVKYDNTGVINGGTLKFYFDHLSSDRQGILSLDGLAGSINTDELYILRFSMLSSLPDKKVNVSLQNAVSPYEVISPEKSISVNTSPKSYEILLDPEASRSSSSVHFVVNEGEEILWIDNVELYAASVKYENPDDYIQFVYNSTGEDLNFSDGKYHIDTYGNKVTSCTIQPYSSVVLFNVSKEFYDNYPSTIGVNSVSVSSDNGKNKIDIPKGTLQMVATVEPSNASLKTVSWLVNNLTGEAKINSNGLVTAVKNGTVEVIATAQDGSGVSGSITLYLSNQSVQSGTEENPSGRDYIVVKDHNLFAYLKDTLSYQNISVFSIAGVLLYTQKITENNFAVNLNQFMPGIYIVVLSGVSGSRSIKFSLP